MHITHSFLSKHFFKYDLAQHKPTILSDSETSEVHTLKCHISPFLYVMRGKTEKWLHHNGMRIRPRLNIQSTCNNGKNIKTNKNDLLTHWTLFCSVA